MEINDPDIHEVVIIGAGPVGLALALGLARQGRDVLVLEKNESTAQHSRAPAIWPGTQEILADLGIIDTFLEEGIIMDRLEMRDADHDSTLLTLPLQELESMTAYPHLLILPQSRTEKLLLNALQQEPTADVLFSCEVFKLIQQASKVEIRYRGPKGNNVAYAQYAAGCDGAHSTVRDHLDASLEGITYKLRAALADVEIENGTHLHTPRLTTQPRFAVGIRIRQNIWRMILPFAESEEIPLNQRVEESAANLFDNRRWQPVWQSEFRLHRRVSTRFANGRIVLAGDAAHINSPVGGQGMNVGIQDASILINIIGNALDDSTINPFEKYGRDRRKEIEKGVNQFTDILTRLLLFGEGRMIRPILYLVNTSMHIPMLRRRIMKRFANI